MTLDGKKGGFVGTEKSESQYEDNRYGGNTVNKARQKQLKEYRINAMIMQAEQKRKFGMELTPEEQFLVGNKELFVD